MRIVNLGQVLKSIDGFVDQVDLKTLEAMKYVGESFVAAARENREFKDDTGNLQSSIGYVIAKDGKVLFEAIKGVDDYLKNPKGKAEGLRLAQAVVKENNKGWVLVGVAGMNYGLYVEARGIDVISGSIPGTQELMKEIIDALK